MSNVSYQPAEKVQIHLLRPGAHVSWGFRLQGGTDFQTPLSIQSVNPNAISEQCGLKPGDAILSINQYTSDALTHGEAKEVIMASGNEIMMLVERGAVKIWKPAVTPMNELRPAELTTIKAATGEDIQPVQKTSLIHNTPSEPCTIGSSHNRTARGFGAPKAAVPNVVHSQYNSPMGLYSADNVANTYSQQTAGIQQQMSGMDITDPNSAANGNPSTNGAPAGAGGNTNISADGGAHDAQASASSSSLNAPPIPDSISSTPASAQPLTLSSTTHHTPSRTHVSDSARYEEQKGDTPEYRGYTNHSIQSRSFMALQEKLAGEEENNNSGPGFHKVSAPLAKPPSEIKKQPSMHCGGCDLLATGVIVKAGGVPYHVACFKCASCSMNLKQKGFFPIDGKLYCEIHAKRQSQPGPDMVATAVYR